MVAFITINCPSKSSSMMRQGAWGERARPGPERGLVEPEQELWNGREVEHPTPRAKPAGKRKLGRVVSQSISVLPRLLF